MAKQRTKRELIVLKTNFVKEKEERIKTKAI